MSIAREVSLQLSPLDSALKEGKVETIFELLKKETGGPGEAFIKKFIQKTYLEGSDYPNDYLLNVYQAFCNPTMTDSKEQKSEAMDCTQDAMDTTEDAPSKGANQKESALFTAVKNNDVPTMKSLLQRGAKLFPGLKDVPVEKYLAEFLNTTDPKKLAGFPFSYLTLCAHFKGKEKIPLIVHCIIQNQNASLELLLKAGIHPNLFMQTTIEVFEMIRDYRDLNCILEDEAGGVWKKVTPLHLAAFADNEAAVNLLLTHGAKILIAQHYNGDNSESLETYTPYDFIEMSDNQYPYELISISNDEESVWLDQYTIEFKCDKDKGFIYRLLGLGDREVRGIIPWDELPDFPKEDQEILSNQHKSLTRILDITSKKRETRPYYISENILIALIQAGDRLSRIVDLPYLYRVAWRNHYILLNLLLKKKTLDKMIAKWPHDERQIRWHFGNPSAPVGGVEGEGGQVRFPMYKAIVNGYEEVARELLLAKVDPDLWISAGEDDPNPSLIVAAIYNQKNIIELLLEHKANINIEDDNNQTALHFAAFHQHNPILNLLCERKADVNSKNIVGRTAAQYAALVGNAAALKTLADAGAYLLLADEAGRTIYDYCVIGGHYDLLKFMQKLCGKAKLTIPVQLEQVTREKADEQQYFYSCLLKTITTEKENNSTIFAYISDLVTMTQVNYANDVTKLYPLALKHLKDIVGLEDREDFEPHFLTLCDSLFLRLEISQVHQLIQDLIDGGDIKAIIHYCNELSRFVHAWASPNQRNAIMALYPPNEEHETLSFEKKMFYADRTLFADDAQLDYSLMHQLKTHFSTVPKIEGSAITSLVQSCKNLLTPSEEQHDGKKTDKKKSLLFKLPQALLFDVVSYLRPPITYRTKDLKTHSITHTTLPTKNIFQALEKQKQHVIPRDEKTLRDDIIEGIIQLQSESKRNDALCTPLNDKIKKWLAEEKVNKQVTSYSTSSVYTQKLLIQNRILDAVKAPFITYASDVFSPPTPVVWEAYTSQTVKAAIRKLITINEHPDVRRVFHINERARFYHYLFPPSQKAEAAGKTEAKSDQEPSPKRARVAQPDFESVSTRFLS